MRNVPETVHEYNIPRLNVIFVITSLLLVGSVAWMLYRDYNRDWKKYQNQAKQFEKMKLVLDARAAEQKASELNIDDVRRQLFEAEKTLAKENKNHDRMVAEFSLLKTSHEVKNAEFQSEKQKLDQVVSEYDAIKELNPEDRALGAKLKAVRALQASVLARQAAVDEAKAKLDRSGAILEAEEKTRAELEKQVKKLTKDRDLIEKSLRKLTNPWLQALDSPLIEFASPLTRVEQVIADDQKYDLNFTQVARIDRCTTCHSFVEKKNGLEPGQDGFRFSELPQPWRSHPRLDVFVSPDSPHPIQKFGCSTCHLGWDRGVGFVSAAHTPGFYPLDEEFIYDHWLHRWLDKKSYDGLQQNNASTREAIDAWMKTLSERSNALSGELSGKRADTPEMEVKRVDLSAARSDLKRLTQLASLIPPASTEQGALKKNETQQNVWEEDYGWHPMHHKEDPMRPREFIESSCWKCHQNVTWIPETPDPENAQAPAPGRKINEGIRLVEQAACYSCHKIAQLETTVKYKVRPSDTVDSIARLYSTEPSLVMAANGLGKDAALKPGREMVIPVRVPADKPAPSLLKLDAKITKNWMHKWLLNPKEFRPNTYMPQFWGLDNNRPGMTYPSQDGTRTFDWGDRNVAEIRAITDFVFSRAAGPSGYPAPPAGDPVNGKKLVAQVGCFGCHVENELWEQLPEKDRSLRTHGPMLKGGGSKYDAGWLFAWLKNPGQYRPDSRMPNLRLSDKEAADITAYLLDSKEAEFDRQIFPESKPEVVEDMVVDYLTGSMPLAEAVKKAQAMPAAEQNLFAGEKLVRRYGCYSCHQIKGFENEKPISIELSDWASKSVGKLDFGFIHLPKNNYAWLHQKLANPRSFDRVAAKKPQEYLRMPQYNFNELQNELVMTAIMSLTADKPSGPAAAQLDENKWQIENGRWLLKEMNCAGCHVVEGRGGAINATIPMRHMQPPRLEGVGTKIRPDWLYHFLQNPGNHPYRYWLEARMPTFTLTDTQRNSLIKYFALLDKETYPFEQATMMGFHPSQALAGPGEKLFVKFNCLQCHKVRTVEQARADASSAPNLTQVKERMRPQGIITWLENPSGVTPGVPMPAFWPEGKSPVPDVLDGDARTQIEAVRDYLMKYGGQTPAEPQAAR